MKLFKFTAAGFLALASALSRAQQPPNAQTPKGPGFVLRQDLPPMDGKKLRLSVLELEYPPGGSTDRHFHNGPVFVYVLEGAIVSEIVGKPEAVYSPGQSFYESPKGVHSISKNASRTEKARALVVFLNEGADPLTVPLKQIEKQ